MNNAGSNGHGRSERVSPERCSSHYSKKGLSARLDRSKRVDNAVRSNARQARSIWGSLPRIVLNSLANFTRAHGLSVAAGDLQFLDGRWYVTHAALLRIAVRRRCSGISTTLQKDLSDPASNRWIFKATVYKTSGSKGFVGYGDANPSNVSPLVRGAEMRVAETRAVNRALRKAYGIGLCSTILRHSRKRTETASCANSILTVNPWR
jgi:hypothetical protein